MDKQNVEKTQQELRRFREHMQETLIGVAKMEAVLSISDNVDWGGANTVSYECYSSHALLNLKTDIAVSLSYLVDILQPIQGDFEHVFERIAFKEAKEEK